MKRIRVYLFSVLFCCCFSSVRADTNTFDYTSQLSSILSLLQTLRMRVDSIWGYADSIDDVLWNEISGNVEDSNSQIVAIRNTLALIKTRCDEYKPLLETSVSDLETIILYLNSLSSSSEQLLEGSQAIEHHVNFIMGDIETIRDNVHSLGDVIPELQNIKGQIQRILDNGKLNKEETQMQIVNILTGITDQADTIKEALDILTQDGQLEEVTGAIASLKEEVSKIFRLLNTWDQGFFRYLYDRTFPNPYFDFYHISGSPFFENGYLTYSQQIGAASAFSFVDWLANVLVSHIEGLQVINDNLLFIAKVLGTNSQEQAMAEFEDEANETVSTIQSQYTEMINSTSYTPKQFDINKTHLYQVRQFFSGLSGQNSYDSVKVYNMPFNSFEKFGFPTHIEYQYDLSQTSTFWEVCRAFFTCLWVFLFAAVFFMVVRTFYYFYHICFNALAGNRSDGYEFSRIG